MTTRRGFLGLLGIAAAAPVAVAAAKLLPKAQPGVDWSKINGLRTDTYEDGTVERYLYRDPVLDDACERLGYQAQETKNRIIWENIRQYGDWIPISM